MKKISFLLQLFGLLPMLVACSDDSETTPLPPEPVPPVISQAWILNQGAYYYGIASTMDALHLSTGNYVRGVFADVNLQSIGDNAIDGVQHGSKLYVAMYGSDLVWVLDRRTLSIVSQIPTNDPEGICAEGGSVYVSNNDGFVSRIDTTTLQVDRRIEVGPNPAHLTTANGYLYVSISDGYNYDGGYANGYRVGKINLQTFVKEKDIRVGVNPGPICADASGTIFVVSRGDYASVRPQVYRIDKDDSVHPFCEASNIAVKGHTLYAMLNHTDWSATPAVSTLKWATYDTRTSVESPLELTQVPESPIDIDVDPVSGEFYVGSNASSFDYISPGYVYRYQSDGVLVARYEAGVAPCAVIFGHGSE